jgi:hypothetical protein
MKYLALLIAISTVAFSQTRQANIIDPGTIYAGQSVVITTNAQTNAGGGEQIGFYHLEVSTNGGSSWSAVAYDANVGTSATRNIYVTAGAVNTQIVVRMRLAYRYGSAGDVDFNGNGINWGGTWGSWGSSPYNETKTSNPPAKWAFFDVEDPNTIPRVSFVRTGAYSPYFVLTNQWYQVQGRAEDDESNLANIYVEKNWVPFAYNVISGSPAYSDANFTYDTVIGSSATFSVQARDTSNAYSLIEAYQVGVSNDYPQGSFKINGSSNNSTIEFGQTVPVTSSITDGDSNLTGHIFYWDQGNNWLWVHPFLNGGTYAYNRDGWLNLNLGTNGESASGGSSIKSFDFRPTREGTFKFHCTSRDHYWNNPLSPADSNYWIDNAVITLTVTKNTPSASFPNRTIPPGGSTYTVQAADLNATFANTHSGSVAQPSGSATYSIISGGAGAVVVGTQLSAGTVYTIRATYSGDSNYNGQIVDSVWTINSADDSDGDGVSDSVETILGTTGINSIDTSNSNELEVHRPKK